MSFKFVEIIVEGEQSDDKLLDLNSTLLSVAALDKSWHLKRKRGKGRIVLLQILEGILQKICDVFLQELLVGGSKRGLLWSIDWLLHLSGFDEVKHARKEHCLGFEPWGCIRVVHRSVRNTYRLCGHYR